MVNTSVILSHNSDPTSRLYFPMAVPGVGSVEELSRRLEMDGQVFGWKLNIRRSKDGETLEIVKRVATIITLAGVAMLQEWTGLPVVEYEAAKPEPPPTAMGAALGAALLSHGG